MSSLSFIIYLRARHCKVLNRRDVQIVIRLLLEGGGILVLELPIQVDF